MFIATSAFLIIVSPFMAVTEEHIALLTKPHGRRKLYRSPRASSSEANITGRVRSKIRFRLISRARAMGDSRSELR
jgi:hypothetical protein